MRPNRRGDSGEPPSKADETRIDYVGGPARLEGPPLFQWLDEIPSLLLEFDPLACLFVILAGLLLLGLIAVFAIRYLTS